ncbi:hypothetical protein CDAR_416631 [Caerostris darwini]|uniref:Uncharacterized protein n=1 Tax=Caerostris darwini TaxID=1538125 RepID=A0AAV4MKM2_9ARAC|nr:hypothetical protein CDAR_416631 [Caerostris darwini]
MDGQKWMDVAGKDGWKWIDVAGVGRDRRGLPRNIVINSPGRDKYPEGGVIPQSEQIMKSNFGWRCEPDTRADSNRARRHISTPVGRTGPAL